VLSLYFIVLVESVAFFDRPPVAVYSSSLFNF
jgi:hypothetical protein